MFPRRPPYHATTATDGLTGYSLNAAMSQQPMLRCSISTCQVNFRDSRDGCIGAVHFVFQDHSQGVILRVASAVQTNELGTQILEPLRHRTCCDGIKLRTCRQNRSYDSSFKQGSTRRSGIGEVRDTLRESVLEIIFGDTCSASTCEKSKDYVRF